MFKILTFFTSYKLPLMILGGLIIIGGAYLKGWTNSSTRSANAVLKKSLTFVDIEREQNEERDRINSDGNVRDILRSGSY